VTTQHSTAHTAHRTTPHDPYTRQATERDAKKLAEKERLAMEKALRCGLAAVTTHACMRMQEATDGRRADCFHAMQHARPRACAPARTRPLLRRHQRSATQRARAHTPRRTAHAQDEGGGAA
jgi:hypothetical protein